MRMYYFISLLIFLSQSSYAQNDGKLFKLLITTPSAIKSEMSNTISNQNYIGIEIKGSVLPKANIRTHEGYYHLNSRLHSSFSAGINS